MRACVRVTWVYTVASLFQSLVTWDSGNQLTYPIKYHSITYKEDNRPPHANATGFVVETQEDPGLKAESGL